MVEKLNYLKIKSRSYKKNIAVAEVDLLYLIGH